MEDKDDTPDSSHKEPRAREGGGQQVIQRCCITEGSSIFSRPSRPMSDHRFCMQDREAVRHKRSSRMYHAKREGGRANKSSRGQQSSRCPLVLVASRLAREAPVQCQFSGKYISHQMPHSIERVCDLSVEQPP